jgi:hypothetical protein
MSAIASFVDLPLSTLFLGYGGLIAALIGMGGCYHHGLARLRLRMGYSGVLGDPTRMPPGIAMGMFPSANSPASWRRSR